MKTVFKKVPEGYIGYIPDLPGANSQGKTLTEVKENLKEAAELIKITNIELKSRRDESRNSPAF